MLQMLFFTCRSEEKAAVLLHLLRHVILNNTQQTLVFVATRYVIFKTGFFIGQYWKV